ncbi:cytochrome P450 [Corynespora cassiicola Philippines]|uniref:Cytochrome P450 n=1 Tax=Corynespora cassiicola Philippines TaxID=1448308 RepID=A0A2T2NMA8_CORCC|nr:cytochrome P450 [Corynespora cassiicola Philippines]
MAVFVPILFASLSLIAWRLWKFTIIPWLHPQEPRELPYWVPFLGHTGSYVSNGHAVLLRARNYVGSREPFAITLVTRKMYFVVDPEDAANVYKNTTSFVFDKVVQSLQRTFGISDETMTATWKPGYDHAASGEKIDDHDKARKLSSKSLGELSMDFWRMQTVGTEGYNDLETKFSRYINILLSEQVDRAASNAGSIRLSHLTNVVLVGAALRALFGESLLEMQPDLVETYVAFDTESWKLWFKWPFAKTMYERKALLENALKRWVEIPLERRPGRSFLIDTVERTQRGLGTSTSDLAKIMNLIIFVVNTNTYKVCYWGLAHLFNSPSLLSKIQAELTHPPAGEKSMDLAYLRNSTPWTSALFHESLRYYSASSSIRATSRPAVVRGKTIPAGSVVFLPFRPQHFDPSIFGDDADSFDPTRFINDKKLCNSPRFRGFSGGSSYCPGRNIARMQFTILVTSILEKYRVQVAKEGVPQTDSKIPTKGMLAPKEGEEVVLEITRR